jgi:hypothetical protein
MAPPWGMVVLATTLVCLLRLAAGKRCSPHNDNTLQGLGSRFATFLLTNGDFILTLVPAERSHSIERYQYKKSAGSCSDIARPIKRPLSALTNLNDT